MSEVLKDYREFEPRDLAGQIHNLVSNNSNLLLQRNLLGVLVRYGADLDTAESRVIKAQKEKSSVSHYAIVNQAGDVVGAASESKDLPLSKLRFPMPAGLAKGPFSVKYSHANPNVHAWTEPKSTDLLSEAYKELTESALGIPFQVYGFKRYVPSDKISLPWTIEPTRSPQYIHEAITAISGLSLVATRRFNDEESRLKIPSRAGLYAPVDPNWSTAHGMQKELKKGVTPIVGAILGFDENDQMPPKY